MDMSDRHRNFSPWRRFATHAGTGLELAGGWTSHRHQAGETFAKLVRHGVYAVEWSGDCRVTVTWDTPDLVHALGQVGPVVGVRRPSGGDPHHLGVGPVWDTSLLGHGYLLNVFDAPADELLFTPGAIPPWWRYEHGPVSAAPMPVLERETQTIVLERRGREAVVTWNDRQVIAEDLPGWCVAPNVGVRAIEIWPLPGTPGWRWETMAWDDHANPVGPPEPTRVTLTVEGL